MSTEVKLLLSTQSLISYNMHSVKSYSSKNEGKESINGMAKFFLRMLEILREDKLRDGNLLRMLQRYEIKSMKSITTLKEKKSPIIALEGNLKTT